MNINPKSSNYIAIEGEKFALSVRELEAGVFEVYFPEDTTILQDKRTGTIKILTKKLAEGILKHEELEDDYRELV